MKKYEPTIDNNIYIISPFGLGDTYILCMLKSAIEEFYHGKVIYVIKESHVAILNLFRYNYEIKKYTDEQLIQIAKAGNKPTPGKRFVAHPHYVDPSLEEKFFSQEISFLQLYKKCLGLPECASIEPASSYPEVSQELIEKIYPYHPQDVVLFAPEMTSCRAAIDKPMPSWTQAYNRFLFEQEEKIVVNIVDKSQAFQGKIIDLSLSELISLAIHCKKVVSVRSGLCDVVYPKVNNMEVIYSNKDFYCNYSLKDLFGTEFYNPNVIEKKISFANILLAMGFQNCAIYGMGENGKRLLHTLEEDGFPVQYCIDQRGDISDVNKIIYQPTAYLPKVDCILVTVNGQFEEIKHNLKQQTNNIAICNIFDMEIIDIENSLKRIQKG